MNRPIRKVAIALGVLFAALFVNLNVVQVLESSTYRNDPANRRVLLEEYSHPRGSIVIAGGDVIAKSRKTKDELKYLRQYARPELYAAVTGYYSYVYGSSGIERTSNPVLSGDDDRFFTTQFTGLLTGRDPRGGAVELTLNKAAQQAAYNAMKDANGKLRRGAIVAIEPTTGEVLALVSTPSYNPSVLSSHDADAIAHAFACYKELDTVQRTGESSGRFDTRIRVQLTLRKGGTTRLRELHRSSPTRYPLVDPISTPASRFADEYPGYGRTGCGNVPDDPTALFESNPNDPGPLRNRALHQVYPAGSIFKVMVAAQALREGRKPTTVVPAPTSYWPGQPQRTDACPASTASPCVSNFDREVCQNGKTATLEFALAKSCNTTFAALLADQLDIDGFLAELHSFGLSEPYTDSADFDACDPPAYEIPLTVCRSTPGPASDLADPNKLARIAFGQGNVRMTPMQAAMMSAAVANNGTLMKPFLVRRELGPTLSEVASFDGQQLHQILDPSLDAMLQQMMVAVVESGEGTGGPARIPNITVGGKTGTADTGYTKGPLAQPHAWFTGFAIKNGVPKIAVAVVIENAGVAGNEITGGQAAAPVAKSVMEAYLNSGGGN